MAIGSDFEIQNDKDIRHIANSNRYTVLELHRWLQDLADDAAAGGDDFMDITRPTPSERSTDSFITLLNGYNIDDTAAQYLYGGSIVQSGGDVIYDGIKVIAAQGMYLDIIQNGALVTPNFWTTGLNANAPQGLSHQFLLKVRTGGADIDGRRIIGTTREWGKTFSEFKINGTSRGENVMALTYADDLNNATLIATIAAMTNITNTQGYRTIDVNNDGSPEHYYSEWNRDTQSINDLYERTKWLSRRGSASTLYGINGALFRGITHEINVDNPSATDFSAVEPVSWTGGTGQMVAIDDVNAPTKMWIQLLTGVAPTDNQQILGGTSGATCDVNVTVAERSLSTPFVGASTGTSLIGSYGLGVEATDLTASDKVFDLTNTVRQAPNYVTFTVGGVINGEDYILVGPALTGALDTGQLSLNGTLSGAAVTSVVVTEVIPTDTPATGSIRIKRDSGAYTRHAYSAWDGPSKTFTIASTNFSSDHATTGNDVFISYIDKLAASASESFTAVYASNRDLFIRVRDGGVTPIKTFETTGTLGISGGSATAIRTSDA